MMHFLRWPYGVYFWHKNVSTWALFIHKVVRFNAIKCPRTKVEVNKAPITETSCQSSLGGVCRPSRNACSIKRCSRQTLLDAPSGVIYSTSYLVTQCK